MPDEIDPEKLALIRRLHSIEMERQKNVEAGADRRSMNEKAQVARFCAVLHCGREGLGCLPEDVIKSYPSLTVLSPTLTARDRR